MQTDETAIRQARVEDAEALSHLMFRSKGYWDYPRDLMEYWSEKGELSITQEEIVSCPAYLLEYPETGEIIGFYSLEAANGEWELKNLWVAPEHIGFGVGCALFLHACEIADMRGASSLTIVSDPHAVGFYTEMGAVLIGEKALDSPHGTRYLPILRISL